MGVDVLISLSLQATITTNDMIINHTRASSPRIKDTHLLSSTSQAQASNTDAMHRSQTPKKTNFLPAGSVYYEKGALVPTALSCTAAVVDARKYGTCLKRRRNPFVII